MLKEWNWSMWKESSLGVRNCESTYTLDQLRNLSMTPNIFYFSTSKHIWLLLQENRLLLIVQSLSDVPLYDPVECSTPGFPALHHLPEFAQTRVPWISDAIQPSHPLSPSSLPALNVSQHQSLFKWITLRIRCQSIGASASSFQWIFGVDFILD